MKKFLYIILCLLLVVGCFAACDGIGNSGVNLSKYTIIIPENASAEISQQGRNLAFYIKEHTGVDVPVKKDSEVAASNSSKEILIGSTNRSESADALAAAGANASVVKFTGKKLILNGSTDAITADAVQWFVKNYVQEKSGEKYITMDKSLEVVKTYSAVQLVKDGVANFSIVYSANLDDNNGRPLDEDPGYANNGIDLEVKLAMDLQEKLEKAFGVSFTLKRDSEPVTGPEILVGKTNRPAYNKVISQIAWTQYGVGYADNCIVVAGHSTAANDLAVSYFEKMIDKAKKDPTLYLCDVSTRSNNSWISAFPTYEGGIMRGTSECYGDELQYYITNTNEEQYRNYCQKLEYHGYSQYMTNEIPGILISNTYMKDDKSIHVYFTYATGETRIFVGDTDKIKYPSNKAETEYTKVTDPQITQIQLDFSTNSGGMGYVITLEDGSFILIDSGSPTSSSSSKQNKDHVRIWNLLNHLNKRPDGKIIIRAWIITHSHSDHNGVFNEFCGEYGSKVTLENHFECMLPESVTYNSKNPGSKTMNATILHTGMKFDLYGVSLEILYTAEDIYPRKMYYYNDASTTIRVTANDNVVMITGDIADTACDIICERYGNYLKSDIVQVSHHGNIGATAEFYELVNPAVALWPTSKSLFANLITGQGNQRHFVANYKLYAQLNVKENYHCSEYCVTLDLTKGGYVLGSANRYVIGTNEQYK